MDSETVDLEDWARRYLDLWEDQVTALAANRDFSKLLLAQVSAFNAFPAFADAKQAGTPDSAALAAALSSWQKALTTALSTALTTTMASTAGVDVSSCRNADGDEEREQDGGKTKGATRQAGSESSPSGAATAGFPPGAQQPDLDVLTRRLADLEARVADLESGPGALTPELAPNTAPNTAPGRASPGNGGRRRRSTT